MPFFNHELCKLGNALSQFDRLHDSVDTIFFPRPTLKPKLIYYKINYVDGSFTCIF